MSARRERMRNERHCSICRTRPATLRAVPAELTLRELPEGSAVGPNELVVHHAPGKDVFVCEGCFQSNAPRFAMAIDLDARTTSIQQGSEAPVGNAQVDIRGFAPGRCGAPDTADDLRFVKLDAAGRYAGRMPTHPPVTSITRCVTVRFLAPFASGARDTTVIVGDVTFRAPRMDARLDSINVVVIQP